jgi:hypothetical protein
MEQYWGRVSQLLQEGVIEAAELPIFEHLPQVIYLFITSLANIVAHH